MHTRCLDPNARRYERSFKTPSLRSVVERPPHNHGGQFLSLTVLLKSHRDNAGADSTDEIFHADQTDEEPAQIEAFLGALSADSERIP
jgi:cytochrome c peroxidase